MDDKTIISRAMAIIGRKGGLSRSTRKVEIARLNGARRFMSTKCEVCHRGPCHSWHASATKRVTVCLKCMTRYRKNLSFAERKKDVILVQHGDKIEVDDRSLK